MSWCTSSPHKEEEEDDDEERQQQRMSFSCSSSFSGTQTSVANEEMHGQRFRPSHQIQSSPRVSFQGNAFSCQFSMSFIFFWFCIFGWIYYRCTFNFQFIFIAVMSMTFLYAPSISWKLNLYLYDWVPLVLICWN